MQNKYDAILYVEPTLNEAADPRVSGKKGYLTSPKGFTQYMDTDDPKLYSTFSFGNTIRQILHNMGQGFSCQVTDFKKWIVVTVTHSNMITGKSSSKTFLIVFQLDGDGMVLTTHNRYRTISGVDQACSYIRSACYSLQNDTQTRMN